ncbi:hypothetical protein [Amycolatopsis anabasis]|uniref:hypothetical protein n=1 Tax=Amycolatopsis anabasis TaxID=1840409 RepID=UPI0015D45FB8|nr:hypothetical protein [Amycolatopsis anabasis]
MLDELAAALGNCTLAGLRGGIMPILLTMLCPELPWAPGSVYRCVEVISEPGTINNRTFPAGIGKASVASTWATQNAVSECVVDQRGAGFVTMLCDAMAGGLGARSTSSAWRRSC